MRFRLSHGPIQLHALLKRSNGELEFIALVEIHSEKKVGAKKRGVQAQGTLEFGYSLREQVLKMICNREALMNQGEVGIGLEDLLVLPAGLGVVTSLLGLLRRG